MHRLFDGGLNSDEEYYMEDSVDEKLKKREMLMDEILLGYDAKLEQEMEKKLKAARSEQEKAIKLAEQTFAKTIIKGTATYQQQAQSPQVNNIRIANVSCNKNVLKAKSFSEPQVTQSWVTSSKSFLKQTHASPQIRTASSMQPKMQPNQKKVYVRISQSAIPQKPAVKYGTSTLSPSFEPLSKIIDKADRSAPSSGNDDIINISDPFSDLPSDLLPGLYELPNHGFNEVLNNNIITTSDSDDDSKMIQDSTPSPTDNTQGMQSSVQGKVDQDVPKPADLHNDNAQLGDDASVINQSEDSKPAIEGIELNDLGASEDDGPYVVLVIPKHATIDDIMKVLKKAGKGPGTCNEIHKIIAKRKYSNPRKAAIKRRRLEERRRQLMIREEKQTITINPEEITIKQETIESQTELNASSTLTAMSRLVAAEKGIPTENGQPVIRPNDTADNPDTTAKCESVMANVSHEAFVSEPMLQDHGYSMLEEQEPDYSFIQECDLQMQQISVSKPNQDSEPVEFGLSNDHTYATLMYGYTLPEIFVPLAEPVTTPEVIVKTETPDVQPIAKVEIADEIKEEPIQIVEEDVGTQIVKTEEEVVFEPVEDIMSMDTDETEDPCDEVDEASELQDDSTTDDIEELTRRSRRIHQTKKTKLKCSKRPKKRHHSKEKVIPQRSPLLPAKYRCRLCEVMYRKVEDMKEHIVQVHSTQKAPVSVTRRRRDRVVNPSALLSDFEVSALSAVVRLCPTCDKYVPENRIEAHMNNHAPQKHRKLVCDHCCTAFANVTYLNLHKRQCKSTNGRHRCDECGTTYATMSSLQEHRKKHINDDNPVKCERCGKECRNYRALKSHIVVHFSVKPYECPECGKGFTQRTNMENHRRVHTIQTPHKCDLCREKFAHSATLKTHKKKRHGVDV